MSGIPKKLIRVNSPNIWVVPKVWTQGLSFVAIGLIKIFTKQNRLFGGLAKRK